MELWILFCLFLLLLNEVCYALVQFVKATSNAHAGIFGATIVFMLLFASFFVWPEEYILAIIPLFLLFWVRRTSVQPSRLCNREILPVFGMLIYTLILLQGSGNVSPEMTNFITNAVYPAWTILSVLAVLCIFWKLWWLDIPVLGLCIRIFFCLGLLAFFPFSLFILIPLLILWVGDCSHNRNLLFPKPLTLNRRPNKSGIALIEAIIAMALIMVVSGTWLYFFHLQSRYLEDVENRSKVRLAIENCMEDIRMDVMQKQDQSAISKTFSIPGVINSQGIVTAEYTKKYLWKISAMVSWGKKKEFQRTMDLLLYKGE